MDTLSLSQGFTVPSSQAFDIGASIFDEFNYLGKERAGTLPFQDFGSTQDNLPVFVDYEPTGTQGVNWHSDLTAKDNDHDLSNKIDDMSLGASKATFEQFDSGFQYSEANINTGSEAPTDLPAHACSYCLISNPASVVQCLKSGRWFCNGQPNPKRPSCIIMHLVKSKNKEIALHPDAPLGASAVECFATGARNIFSLGVVPAKNDGAVALLARDVSSHHPSVRDLGLDTSQWTPIVQGRALASWIVPPPSEQELSRARQRSLAQIDTLEALWRKEPEADAADADFALYEAAQARRRGEEEQAKPVPLRFRSPEEYWSIFEPLVCLEAQYNREATEGQGRDDVSIRWDKSPSKRHLAFFFFSRDDADVRLVPGDEVQVSHRSPGGEDSWSSTGTVITYLPTEEVCLELHSSNVPENVTTGFSVKLVWKGKSFERMLQGLRKLKNQGPKAMVPNIMNALLGIGDAASTAAIPLFPPEMLEAEFEEHGWKEGDAPSARMMAALGDIPGLPELNHSQIAALHCALLRPLSIIQGPPGTGKTVTSTAAVYHAVRFRKAKVLVSAPSNVAVDQLADRIERTGLKVVRVCARSREHIESPVDNLTLHYQITRLPLASADRYRQLTQARAETGGLSEDQEAERCRLQLQLERMVLHEAEVVCTTCIGASDPRLGSLSFDFVLVDECTQATEPECLLPLLTGVKQVVLVGDHCQLGPIVSHREASNAGFSQSLFERLRLLGLRPARLQVQYRMHPCLSLFPSNAFYDGALQNGAGVADRRVRGDFPWPNPDKPMAFWVQLGTEEISPSGTSYLNRTEALNVERAVTRLLQSGMKPSQIGIITPYEGQRAYITATLLRHGSMMPELYREVEVLSVDAFQGREKEVIVVSCVRANDQLRIGFLADARRLNVALTRAKGGLLVLGNPKVLVTQPVWAALLAHFKDTGTLVEGPLTHLKPAFVTLPKEANDLLETASFGSGFMANRYQPPEYVGEPVLPKLPVNGGTSSIGHPPSSDDHSQLLHFPPSPSSSPLPGVPGSGNTSKQQAVVASVLAAPTPFEIPPPISNGEGRSKGISPLQNPKQASSTPTTKSASSTVSIPKTAGAGKDVASSLPGGKGSRGKTQPSLKGKKDATAPANSYAITNMSNSSHTSSFQSCSNEEAKNASVVASTSREPHIQSLGLESLGLGTSDLAGVSGITGVVGFEGLTLEGTGTLNVNEIGLFAQSGLSLPGGTGGIGEFMDFGGNTADDSYGSSFLATQENIG
uniref:Upf1 domain-containing protein n=1 Tax=Polytomella parva TaxID=51329 RepID=A0A7S0YDA7_9CHLO|mmetsp:Transcript_19194/g.34731  ORF Transcript_19194/g.34731 Transcript_19194/m.34731 type:complete len:1253 (+) Transcript_19194:105-3863(+)|eukprot:CAMPEP_0175047496 /NCGR_PEP_ID=MMETSP0052_2-20121109/5630_1 /TAXON_ID=51329 ORGANISM="Polytomella parva, Strain SAG 63-3" /NCGR_SAMPLE_ID=MMETSP0052_2 /ASSEMBLY_ACC=CAM_ASM_000194 /LENGTH=1252 /DNA_ID=CAMNT_0016311383 /DNA_START=59 /DNA_END=3817 /DNA_ORIENTATION=+